jgi:hypothetical protein
MGDFFKYFLKNLWIWPGFPASQKTALLEIS